MCSGSSAFAKLLWTHVTVIITSITTTVGTYSEASPEFTCGGDKLSRRRCEDQGAKGMGCGGVESREGAQPLPLNFFLDFRL